MGASAVSLKALQISMDAPNAEYLLLEDGASDDPTTRLQLIETIKSNVMDWTRWNPVAVADANRKISDT